MRPSARRGFTLIEIMVVVLLIGILLAIAIPNFVSARESSRAKACISNLSQINSAKVQCTMDNKLSATSSATFIVDGVTPTTTGPNGVYQLTDTTGRPNYIRVVPVCPSSGAYVVGDVATTPSCSVATGSLAGSDYAAGGKWFHGY